MIEFINATKIYKLPRGKSVKALDGINLAFKDSGMIFLCGGNGSGKSTLLNLVAGTIAVSGGDVVVDGLSLKKCSSKELDGYRNTYIGYIFQDCNLIEGYSVGENIAISLEMQGRKVKRADVESALKTVGLTDDNFYDREISQLSGGQMQRVAIARAVAKGAKILLADEPTSSLDEKAAEDVLNLLKSLSADMPVIVVSHDGDAVKKYANRIITLKDGKVTGDSSPVTLSSEVEKKEKSGLKLSRIPFSRLLGLAFKGLKHHRIRLAISVFLCAVMSASFVFFFTCQFVDSNVPQIRKCYEDGYRMVNLESCATYVSHANGETTVREQSVINEEQAEIVREYGGGKIMYVSDAEYLHFFTSEYLTENPWEYGYAKPTTRYQMSAAANPYEVVELDPETGMEDALLTPDSRFLDPSLCSLPQTFTEVAITDLTFDGFKIFGYTDDDGINYEIKTPDDIIGKKLGEYTVCGVFSTEVSLDEYRERLDVPYDATYSDGIGRGKTIFFDIFVKSGWRESISGVFLFSHLNGFMIKLSGDLNKDKQLLEDLRFPWNWNDSALVYNMDMKIVSRYYKYIDKADVLWNDFVVNASRILGCVMAVVAFLLLFTFFSVNFDARGKEMEVLSALGASSRDIAKINVTESFYVASMIFALTMIGVFVYCAAFSSWAMIEIFYVGLMQWLMGIGICYIIPMIAVGVFLLIRSRKTARR